MTCRHSSPGSLHSTRNRHVKTIVVDYEAPAAQVVSILTTAIGSADGVLQDQPNIVSRAVVR
ncbi:MAG: hypothetical protein AAF628_33220 [Planctomycetota bacterium]